MLVRMSPAVGCRRPELTLYRFCKGVLGIKTEKQCWETVNFRNVTTFLDWQLGLRVEVDGRATKGMAAKQSLTTFSYNFRLAYERETWGKNINDVVPNKKIRIVRSLPCPPADSL